VGRVVGAACFGGLTKSAAEMTLSRRTVDKWIEAHVVHDTAAGLANVASTRAAGRSAILDERVAESLRHLRMHVHDNQSCLNNSKCFALDVFVGNLIHVFSNGGKRGGAWLEPLLAEGVTSLLGLSRRDESVLPEDVAERFARRRRVREEAEARRAREEERAERALGLAARSTWEESGAAELFGRELPRDPRAIDGELRALCRELLLADLAFAALADRLWRMRGWRVLGYASGTQYARERLGMSRSSVRQRVGLVRRVGERSELARALVSGRVGFEAACPVSRVTGASWCAADEVKVHEAMVHEATAHASVEAVWVERAEARTYKHLREEVSAVQLLARLEDRSLSDGPPTDAELERVRSMERDAKSGGAAREALMDVEREVSPSVAVVQMSVGLPLHLARRLDWSVAAQVMRSGSALYLGCTTTKLCVSVVDAEQGEAVASAHDLTGVAQHATATAHDRVDDRLDAGVVVVVARAHGDAVASQGREPSHQPPDHRSVVRLVVDEVAGQHDQIRSRAAHHRLRGA